MAFFMYDSSSSSSSILITVLFEVNLGLRVCFLIKCPDILLLMMGLKLGFYDVKVPSVVMEVAVSCFCTTDFLNDLDLITFLPFYSIDS
jgi:hypothetical protein